jgi:hypothetical protein
MPLGIDPETALIIGLVGAVGAIGTFTVYDFAAKAGPKLTVADLRPAAPWEGLPLPIFFYTKPELLAELRRK